MWYEIFFGTQCAAVAFAAAEQAGASVGGGGAAGGVAGNIAGAASHGMENNPFAVFTFLVAPAILTNACTVLALGTSNRLARAVDRTRAIANVLVTPKDDSRFSAVAAIPRELAEAQFVAASERCRVLIRALRCFYLAVGCFAGGTSVAMLGASLGYFGNQQAATVALMGMLVFAGVGVVSLVVGSVWLVRETTLTLSLLIDEQAALSSLERQIMAGKHLPNNPAGGRVGVAEKPAAAPLP